MSLDKALTQEAKEFRNRIVAAFIEHEALQHKEAMCPDRLGLIAFFCHSLGIDKTYFPDLERLLTDYDHHCKS